MWSPGCQSYIVTREDLPRQSAEWGIVESKCESTAPPGAGENWDPIENRWCPAHRGVPGNEKADEWDKLAAGNRYVRPTKLCAPATTIPTAYVHS